MKMKHASSVRLAVLVLLAISVFNSIGAVPVPKFGTPSSAIGTFDGWTGWIGWYGSFSETYNPLKERYAWMVFFAPEAIYVAQQGSMADYTGVDVNIGFKYFYGFLKTSSADKSLTKQYFSSLWSVSISKEAIPLLEGIGPMSHLSMGLEVEVGLMRVEHTKKILPGIQFGAGFSVSYSLLPVQLPFCIELDRDWIPNDQYAEAPFFGFYPIAVWGRPVVPGQNPAAQIQAGLQELAGNTGVPATTFTMAAVLAPMMQQLAADPDLQAFFTDPNGGGRYSQAMTATETWLVSGDPGKAPTSIVPGDDKKVPEVVKPVLVGTQLGYQTGYRVGAESNPNSKWKYVDGVITNYCYSGESCHFEITARDLCDLIPGTVPADFEGAPIGFYRPQEYWLDIDTLNNPWLWVPMSNGVAQFSLNQSLTTSQIVRVRYSDAAAHSDVFDWDGNVNHGISIELKTHVLVFLDPTDVNGNQIPDFWEQQYGLTSSVAGTDTDHDGFTDYQEYVAGTDPTNPKDYPKLQFSANLFKSKKLTIPFTDAARRYTIEGNTNSLATGKWFPIEDFYGEDASSDVDISSYLKATNAIFRLKIRRY